MISDTCDERRPPRLEAASMQRTQGRHALRYLCLVDRVLASLEQRRAEEGVLERFMSVVAAGSVFFPAVAVVFHLAGSSPVVVIFCASWQPEFWYGKEVLEDDTWLPAPAGLLNSREASPSARFQSAR